MADLMRRFEWGSLKSGFATVDGVYLEGHPNISRGGASFVSSHGALATSGFRLEFDKPLKFLGPVERGDRREAQLMKKGLAEASEAQFSMAELDHRRYSLFDDQTGLFRDFSELRSESAVVGFADRFGPLGADFSTGIVDVVPEEPWKKGIEIYWAEPIELWLAEAMDMARVVGLSELIQAGDQSVFTPRLTRSAVRLKLRTGTPADKFLGKDWVLAKKTDDAALFRKISEVDEQNWPSLLLAQWIERGLSGRSEFGVSASSTALAPTMTPKGLIGALWLQALFAISGEVNFLRCRECRTWFEVSTKDARPDKRFCSNACRMRAYRRRKSDGEVKAAGAR